MAVDQRLAAYLSTAEPGDEEFERIRVLDDAIAFALGAREGASGRAC